LSDTPATSNSAPPDWYSLPFFQRFGRILKLDAVAALASMLIAASLLAIPLRLPRGDGGLADAFMESFAGLVIVLVLVLGPGFLLLTVCHSWVLTLVPTRLVRAHPGWISGSVALVLLLRSHFAMNAWGGFRTWDEPIFVVLWPAVPIFAGALIFSDAGVQVKDSHIVYFMLITLAVWIFFIML
jgi:hypothetical protein